MKNLSKVKDYPHLYRDEDTGAILNYDTVGYNQRLRKIERQKSQKEEPAMNIIEEILSGLETNDFVVEANRKDAIELALRRANKNDVIVIAGKGHETTQEISGRLFDFNDREHAIRFLRQ